MLPSGASTKYLPQKVEKHNTRDKAENTLKENTSEKQGYNYYINVSECNPMTHPC